MMTKSIRLKNVSVKRTYANSQKNHYLYQNVQEKEARVRVGLF
jgi:hypothetical protein